MKVVKRDGKIVDFDREKIRIAIGKANEEVNEEDRISNVQVTNICKHIENLNKKRILVEDIQDIIEERLVDLGKYNLAKSYIIYRYNRALVRKSNTTDESILSLIKNRNNELKEENPNRDSSLVSNQRDLIAGEVSKDITKRMLLPLKIVKAHEEGVLHFHDMAYFLQPIFNSCIVNIQDMLDNGTVINGKMIESPKSFQVACMILTQIIASVASNQYGGLSIDTKHLGKYLRKSKEKFKNNYISKYKGKIKENEIDELVEDRLKDELSTGIQIIQYQINTLMTTNGQSPFVTLFLNIDEQDPYIEENRMIIEEILNQRYKGMKDKDGNYITPSFPKLIYVLNETNNLNGGKYDYLTKLAIKCSQKRIYPDYISSKVMKENYNGNVFSPMGSRNFLSPWKDEHSNYKFEGRFNQGVVSINLPQIALEADADMDLFWKYFDERLDLCYEALMCRHHALLGTLSSVSPIHYEYGCISRLNNEKIDKLLTGGYSTLSLGYIGLYEVTKLMTGKSHTTLEGQEFALKVMNKLKSSTEKWSKETNLSFTLYGTPSNNLCYRFAKIDKEKYGSIKDITDKNYYTNSYHIDIRENIDIFEKLKFESQFQKISTGGFISYININNIDYNDKFLEDLIKFVYENIEYISFNKGDYLSDLESVNE